jgi:hypothetical protein
MRIIIPSLIAGLAVLAALTWEPNRAALILFSGLIALLVFAVAFLDAIAKDAIDELNQDQNLPVNHQPPTEL